MSAALSILCGCIDWTTWQGDDRLGTMVKQRLLDYQDVNLLEVEVSVFDGVVYLSGDADEFSYKETAERIARRVDGVRDVVNKVKVEP